MMGLKRENLFYEYPQNLVGTEPKSDFRTMLVESGVPQEIDKEQIFSLFQPGDLLVINDTKVIKRRVFSEEDFEILFLRSLGAGEWEALLPASRLKKNQKLHLPQGVTLELVAKGIPQRVRVSKDLPEEYFAENGELALPPYIQKARDSRHNIEADDRWYQTDWAEHSGSCAAPTASLHFTNQDLEILQGRGVQIAKVTLHVGLGTFLPIKAENLQDHQMHCEDCFIPQKAIDQLTETKKRGDKIFALGTTATRSLESWAAGKLQVTEGGLFGSTDLFITPGFEYKYVDVLMTNFHQPESTLLALVGAFAGLDNVLKAYKWAIAREFRLFSYGDFSIWIK